MIKLLTFSEKPAMIDNIITLRITSWLWPEPYHCGYSDDKTKQRRQTQ